MARVRRAGPLQPSAGVTLLRRLALLPAGLLAASLYLMAEVGLQRAELFTLAPLYAAAFVALAWAWTHHRGALERPGVILFWALAFRALLLPVIPDLSDDGFRYVWDGWLTAMGQNPYAWVPADPALADFHDDELLERMNSAQHHSVYPPFSQLVFFFPGIVHEFLGWPASFVALKGLVVTLEGMGIALMLAALRGAGRPLAPAALYAWNPLVLVTVAGNGHSEGAMMLGIGLLALGIHRGRDAVAWVGMVLAGLVKLVPFVAAPLLFRRAVETDRPWSLLRGIVVAGVLGAAMVAPFWFPGLLPNVASSLRLYVTDFEFAAGAHHLLQELAVRVTGPEAGPMVAPALKGVVALVLVLVALFHPTRRPEDFFRALLVVVSTYLVLATTIHPWYVLWALALLPFTGFLRGAWMWASFAAFGTYFTYIGVPEEPLAALLWVPFALLAVAAALGWAYDRLLRWAGRRKARAIDAELGGGRILDLGAGEGYVARSLVGPGRRFILADRVPAFRVDLPGVACRGERLPFRDRSFDGTVVAVTLHHLEEPEAAVREALRVSAGPVVVTETVAESPTAARVLELMDRAVNRPRGWMRRREPLRFRSQEEWVHLFEEAGGRVERSVVLGRWLHRHVLFVVEPAEISRPTAARTSAP